MTETLSLAKVINLLSDLVVFDSYTFSQFLKKLIKLLSDLISVDSCLIYFYDRTTKQLILVGSKQSHKKLLGKITLKTGEGITGWVAAHKKTVVLSKNAYRDARFKFFKELPEDLYEAFLSVPIVDKEGIVGVINFQHKKPYEFNHEQIKTVEAIVKIIASAFETVALQRKIVHLESKLEERKVIEKAKGILMKQRNLSEKQAYDLIQNEAMKKRKTMREIADAVLLIY